MKKAFTLIELLVVIAIIAILAAILFPVFAQAKFAAKKTLALSNTKQIATANLIYINDYDDIIVPGLVKADAGTVQGVGEASPGSVRSSNSFDILLAPYIKNIEIWYSPVSDKVSGAAATRSITQNAKVSVQFSSFSFGPAPTVLSATQAESPANLILMGDGQPFAYGSPSNFTGNLDEPYYACLAYQALANKTTLFTSSKPYVRYNGTANYAYSDGHAKATQPEKTLSPNNQWYPEYPLATDQIANPQGGGFFSAPPAGTGGLTPTTNCSAFRFWNGR